MAEFKYGTQIFSGNVKEEVIKELNAWLDNREGNIEVVSSNMIVFNDDQNHNRLTFCVYNLFIEFPVKP